MAIYETIPTTILAKRNAIMPRKELPELVHLHDAAQSVFINFSRETPALISPQTLIDEAIHIMKIKHVQMLLVQENNHIVGLVSQEDLLSERPLLLMQEKGLNRSETTVDLLMKPRNEILVMEIGHLKKAQVGHIINTIKAHATSFILVVKKIKGKHLIRGLFSASQIGRQLHIDLTSVLTKTPETIIELHQERKA